MIKFFCGILIVCITTYIGNLFARKYKKRISFFTQMSEFNTKFLTEITYYKRPLSEFIVSCKTSGAWGQVLNLFIKNNKNSNKIHASLKECIFLKKEEIDFVEEYMSFLGKGDSTSQNAYFLSKGKEIEILKNTSIDENKRYSDLYWKLGFLLGLAILVLIA